KPNTNDIRKVTPEKLMPQKVMPPEHSPVLPPADSYQKAHNFITGFNKWRSGKLPLPNSGVYEKRFATQLPAKAWIKLRDELKLSENEDQSVFLLQFSLFLLY